MNEDYNIADSDNKENIDNGSNDNKNNDNKENIDKKVKKFSQEDLERILKERLSRSKKDAVNLEEVKQRETAISEKEKELNARELKLECMAFLTEKGLPIELCNILQYSSLEDFKNTIEIAVNSIREPYTAPLASTEDTSGKGNEYEAFKNGMHTPKKFGKQA